MQDKKNRCGIVIVTFRNAKEIGECLDSVLTAVKGKQYPILVVDNNSSDETVAIIQSYAKKGQVGLIANKTNVGFAKAVNQGMKRLLKQGVRKIILLNPDTVVGKNFIGPLQDAEEDLVSPLIRFTKDRKDVYDLGGNVHWLFGRQYNLLSHTRPKKIETKQRDYLSGSCLCVDKKVIDKIGFFNEKYFMYFEDVDFCLRAKKAGFTLGIAPNSTIFHKVSASSNQVPRRKIKYLLQSNFLFIGDHVPAKYKPIAYGYIALLAFKMTVDPNSKIKIFHDH